MSKRLLCFIAIGRKAITMRLPIRDPRTIARDISGVFDALFPQLAQGVVASFNRGAIPIDGCEPVSQELVEATSVQRAMLFETAVAAAEQLIEGGSAVDWDLCLGTAVARQKAHFDAKLPQSLTSVDKEVSLHVARNLIAAFRQLRASSGTEALVRGPRIPGFQWVASSVGDFSIGRALIEVKCTNKHFISSDYRQILMYWLLSYCAALETGATEWADGVLVNPRLNRVVRFSFNGLIPIVGAGKSKVELVELFSTMLGTRVPLTPRGHADGPG
ncbi:hypothetical protein JQ559_12070 [Bradyrhizobium viridifuturi]|nr:MULTISPECIES: hypothetical protein [Bradyrhizobium]QRI72367.1 hypothetical protein JQ507_13240 [Bradyrhizobium sp. PSBB068]MBR1021344.1 hypothetical protein [Bradyrhizobium viridifuturi]MBR1035419.1 hypothetical protein [Bradyrhizobium viridifuturi]MBR1044386.1 hypothetical protein [Bradyrhizobium viridifuturi]MBR1074063.1 hypothetical protein [Bradyrhizobium viridifuturi]